MSDRFRHLLVGLTGLCGIVGLAALLMLFGYVPDWLEGGYVVKVRMTDAGGLTAGSRLKLNGLDVGRVVTIELQQPVNKGVIITAKVKEEFNLPQGVTASVSPTFLGGSPALDFEVAHLTGNEPSLPRNGSAEIEGRIASIAGQLTSALEGPKKDLTRLVDTFEKLSNEWNTVGKNISMLTAPLTPAEVDGSNGAKAGNITTVLARADQRLAEMREILGGVNSLLNDPKMREDLKITLVNVKDASANIKEVTADAKTLVAKAGGTVDKVDGLVSSAQGNLDQLTKRYVAVADDLSGSILAMRKTIDQAREGNGTVGKLLNDPSLYNNLNDSVKKLDSALVDMKLLIQKWEKEGIIKF